MATETLYEEQFKFILKSINAADVFSNKCPVSTISNFTYLIEHLLIHFLSFECDGVNYKIIITSDPIGVMNELTVKLFGVDYFLIVVRLNENFFRLIYKKCNQNDNNENEEKTQQNLRIDFCLDSITMAKIFHKVEIKSVATVCNTIHDKLEASKVILL